MHSLTERENSTLYGAPVVPPTSAPQIKHNKFFHATAVHSAQSSPIHFRFSGTVHRRTGGSAL